MGQLQAKPARLTAVSLLLRFGSRGMHASARVVIFSSWAFCSVE